MNIAQAILWKYPNAVPVDDFIIVDHNDGNGQQIELWNLKDSTGADIPVPSNSNLQDWYLSFLKENKNTELEDAFNTALINGFKSSALGSEHTYPADAEAKSNFALTINRFLTDPAYTETQFKTLDTGFLPHTKDQFFKVFADGHDFGILQDIHYNRLKAQVSAATTTTVVESINWNTPPAVPSGLTATGGTGQVTLSWTANKEIDLAGYNVFQDGNKVNSSLITANAYTITGLKSGTFSFTVTAVDMNGNESAPCTVVSGWDI